MLVGDSNQMDVSAELLSMDGKTVIGTFGASVNNDAALNGVLGATVAAIKSEGEVQRQLDAEAADRIFEKIYGTKSWKSWSRRH
jgi:hypothetical protein